MSADRRAEITAYTEGVEKARRAYHGEPTMAERVEQAARAAAASRRYKARKKESK